MKTTAIWALAAPLLVAAAPAAARQADRPVRVVTAPAARPRAAAQLPARAYLADELAGVAADGPAGAPDPALAPHAAGLGLRDAATRSYGGVAVEVYRTRDESTAFALLRSLRPEGAQPAAAGDGGWASADAQAFWSGPYVAVVRGEGDATATLARAVDARIGRVSAPAPLFQQLPEAGRIEESLRYAPSFDAIRSVRADLTSDVYLVERGGAHAVIADYRQPGAGPMRVTLVEYETPQLAADGERSLKAFYDALPPDTKLGRMTRREGNYLIEAVNVADPATAAAIMDSVDYAFQVKWLKEPTPTPQLNQLDAAQEARNVAQVLVSSFAIVGLALLTALGVGGLFGAWVFRLRRRAVRNAFSDAGGMVVLDLDDALPPTSSPRLLRSADVGDD